MDWLLNMYYIYIYMKRILILLALILVGLTCIAQDYLGKSLEYTRADLKKSGITSHGYISKDFLYIIRCDISDTERRFYIFDNSGCIEYIISFSNIESIQSYRAEFARLGYVQGSTDGQNIVWTMQSDTYRAVCVQIDTANAELYQYNIVVNNR